jgi:hypothetical protein
MLESHWNRKLGLVQQASVVTQCCSDQKEKMALSSHLGQILQTVFRLKMTRKRTLVSHRFSVQEL